MKKLSFILVILLLGVLLNGCAVGYSRATYAGNQYKGLSTKISMPIMRIDDSSHLSGEMRLAFYNNETNPQKADILDSGLGISYSKTLFPGFGIHGGGGYGNTGTTKPNPNVANPTQPGSGIYYEAGITAFNILNIGYRSVQILGNSVMDAYYAELQFGIPGE